ncbi:MAG: hypothetical protein A2298_01925 [Gammaproteobacteria bacterium RIFOXYB2_FULL_38_6]|nr:MAG: hypothetical protein A2298_01925 [Gammaproteobacteria bacterium RIFOXYB2_FULL_38_6]
MIFVDDRERQSQIVSKFLEKNMPVQIKRLPFGDICIDGKLWIERKTAADFVQSIADTRLFKQIQKLASSDKKSILIIEGDKKIIEEKMSHEAMQGAFISISIFFGIPILYASCTDETVQLILYLKNQLERISVGGATKHGRKPKRLSNKKLYVIQSLPDIGYHKAKKLLETFGSVEAITRAKYHELMQVVGIGETIARKIREVLE